MRSPFRLLLLAGAVGTGALLFRAAPRQLELVYDLGGLPGATSLEVEIRRQGGELIRRAELRVAADRQLRHAIRLPDGQYRLAYRVATPAGAIAGERPLEVREAGTIVLPLAP